MSIDERCGPVACQPEMATLNCGSLNFGDDVFINTRKEIRLIAERIQPGQRQGLDRRPPVDVDRGGRVEQARQTPLDQRPERIAHRTRLVEEMLPAGVTAGDDQLFGRMV